MSSAHVRDKSVCTCSKEPHLKEGKFQKLLNTAHERKGGSRQEVSLKSTDAFRSTVLILSSRKFLCLCPLGLNETEVLHWKAIKISVKRTGWNLPHVLMHTCSPALCVSLALLLVISPRLWILILLLSPYACQDGWPFVCHQQPAGSENTPSISARRWWEYCEGGGRHGAEETKPRAWLSYRNSVNRF